MTFEEWLTAYNLKVNALIASAWYIDDMKAAFQAGRAAQRASDADIAEQLGRQWLDLSTKQGVVIHGTACNDAAQVIAAAIRRTGAS